MRTQNPSDLSVPKSTTTAKKYVHTDLDLAFIPNPMTGDINPLRDVEAIKNSVKNLISTNFQERPFQPEVGSNLNGLLFELATNVTASMVSDDIRNVITNFEPRAKIDSILVSADPDNNLYNVTLQFYIGNNVEPTAINLILERTR